jgi:protein-S-isoprenylcysteine O-methyltransferase Ste14
MFCLYFIIGGVYMGNSEFKKAGVNREYSNSNIQKYVFTLGHLSIILFLIWLIFFNGLRTSGKIFGKTLYFSDYQRAKILLYVAILYWVRHFVTLFYLLARKVEWSEVFGLLAFIGFFEIMLVLIGGGVFKNTYYPLGYLDFLALLLLLFGSYLNSYSEIQRKWWKQNPENKGHCYTEGLFKYSMHINYFGDTVLFTGWVLLTHNIWTLLFPVLMGYSFVIYHIPGLDSYLLNRYGDEFKEYSKKTKKFIPKVY